MLHLFREQPRPFYMIFMLEIWERFGYYTLQGVIVLYFIRALGFSEENAYYTFGAFFALIYSMVALGGYLGDQVLGTKRTLVLGLVILAMGYFALAWVSRTYVFLALGLICVGNGLFKANPSALLSKCYATNDARLYSGFTLYYMAINIGAIAALFVGPFISNRYGYAYAYSISGVGILIGFLHYVSLRRHLDEVRTSLDDESVAWQRYVLVGLGVLALTVLSSVLLQHVLLARRLLALVIVGLVAWYVRLMQREVRAVRARMLLALILMVQAVIFFTLYHQMPTSINLFAVNNVHATFLGLAINPQSFQVLNPLWIFLLSPILAWMYKHLESSGVSFSVTYKFALGMLLCGGSFLVLFLSRYAHDSSGLVSSWWLVGSYFLQSMGELLVSALGVAMVAELVPSKIVGFVMGLWFLTSSVAGFTGAAVASLTALPRDIQPGLESLVVYTTTFGKIGWVTLAIGLLLWLIAPKLDRLMGSTSRV